MTCSALALLLTPLLVLAAVQDPEPAWKTRPVPDSDRDIRPALIGSKVPAATVKDVEGKPRTLASLFQEGPTILIFYRGGW